VVSLTGLSGFERRLRRTDVAFHAIDPSARLGVRRHVQLWRLLRRLRPALVHTRNLAALEMQAVALAAGVPVRVHGEHGWDVHDPGGQSVRYRLWRRLMRPCVHHYIALSRQIENYLAGPVGVSRRHISQIYNGVDTGRFTPVSEAQPASTGPFDPEQHFLVGTVGRLAPIKDQLTLARAFVLALRQRPDLRQRLRLVLVGDGQLRAPIEQALRDGQAEHLAWLPGSCDDVPALLRGLDLFVLPSLAEGISNTILEAMASGLPVVATDVGGNGELVERGVTGSLVPPADPLAMADALIAYADDPRRGQREGQAGRARAETAFGLEAMASAYQNIYDRLLAGRGTRRTALVNG
jgi:sugar transferase (PEP-CTERM/EpsH1 system associated)